MYNIGNCGFKVHFIAKYVNYDKNRLTNVIIISVLN